MLQHYELCVSPLIRVCRIVHLQKVCFKGSQSSQEDPCVLANFFLVWDFPDSFLRGWTFGLEITCSVTAVLCLLSFYNYHEARRLKQHENHPAHIALYSSSLEALAAVTIHTFSRHLSSLVSHQTTASLHETFTVVGVNGVAAAMEAWRKMSRKRKGRLQ